MQVALLRLHNVIHAILPPVRLAHLIAVMIDGLAQDEKIPCIERRFKGGNGQVIIR